MKNASAKIKVGCLFAAMGGFCKAFEQVGAVVLWANEKDRFARETFLANFPHVRHYHKPIEDLTVAGDGLDSGRFDRRISVPAILHRRREERVSRRAGVGFSPHHPSHQRIRPKKTENSSS